MSAIPIVMVPVEICLVRSGTFVVHQKVSQALKVNHSICTVLMKYHILVCWRRPCVLEGRPSLVCQTIPCVLEAETIPCVLEEGRRQTCG